MRIKKLMASAAVAFAAAAAVVGLSTISASASGSYSYDTASFHHWVGSGVLVQIWEKGDKFQLCDTLTSDGVDAYISFHAKGSLVHSWHAPNGKCVTNTDTDMPEGKTVYVVYWGSGYHARHFLNDH